MIRMWINQPSTLQEFHHLHGVNVLAEFPNGNYATRIYFLEGETISQMIPHRVLSRGWLTKKDSK